MGEWKAIPGWTLTIGWDWDSGDVLFAWKGIRDASYLRRGMQAQNQEGLVLIPVNFD